MKNIKKTEILPKKSSTKKDIRRKQDGNVCAHGGSKGVMTLTVLGKKFRSKHPLFCKKCAEKYLNKYATTCNACGEPILPGQPVAGTGIKKSKYPFTHTNFDCCVSGGLYCGTWGKGKLIPLNTL